MNAQQNEQPVVGRLVYLAKRKLTKLMDRASEWRDAAMAKNEQRNADYWTGQREGIYAAREAVGEAADELRKLAGEDKTAFASSAWVGDAPPATPDSEGWWWVADPETREGQPVPAWVSTQNGELVVHIWGAEWSHFIQQFRGRLRWGGRLAVNGASPTSKFNERRSD